MKRKETTLSSKVGKKKMEKSECLELYLRNSFGYFQRVDKII